MSPALSKSLIDILLASGAPSREEAVALAANLNGNSWTADVLNSGKVDEQRFLNAIGEFFNVPVLSIDAKKIERGTLLPEADADVTIIDPTAEWTIDVKHFRSKSRNCPFAGLKVRGRAEAVIVSGEVKHS